MQSFLKDFVKKGTLDGKIFPCGAWNWPCGASVNAEQFYTKGARAGSLGEAVFLLIFCPRAGGFFYYRIFLGVFSSHEIVFPLSSLPTFLGSLFQREPLDDLSSQNRSSFPPQNRALLQSQSNYKAFPGDRDFIARKCVTMHGTHFGISDELQAPNALIFASLDSRATREQGGWDNEVAPRERLEIAFLVQSRRSGRGAGGARPPVNRT